MGVSNGGWLAHWYEIAGIIIALPIVSVCLAKILTFFAHVQGVHEAIVGKPATVYSEEVPSMIARFKTVETGVIAAKQEAAATARLVADVNAQLHPNGGTSMRDSLDRNEQITVATGREVAGLVKRVEGHIADDTQIWNELGEGLKALAGGQDEAVRDRVEVAATAIRVAADVAQTTIDTASDVAQTVRDTAEGVAKMAVDVAVDVAQTAKDTAEELHRTGP